MERFHHQKFEVIASFVRSVKTLMSIFLGKWDPFSLNKQPTSFYRGSIHVEKKNSLFERKGILCITLEWGWCGKKFVADPFILQRMVFNLAKKNFIGQGYMKKLENFHKWKYIIFV